LHYSFHGGLGEYPRGYPGGTRSRSLIGEQK